jgi:hypothetical protein
MWRNRMHRVLTTVAAVVICASVGDAAQKPEDGTKKLTLHRAGQVTGAELQLLPKLQESADTDAFPMYLKAIQSLSKELDWNKVRAWRQVPVGQLPEEEVGAVLRSFEASMPFLEQAGKCKRCNWTMSAEGDAATVDLNMCRNLVFLIALRARSELARGDCASCVRTLGMGLAMARHLNEGPTAIHLLVGVAVGAVVFAEIEQYVQQPGSPSLEAAIRAIPPAFFDKDHSEIYGMDEEGRNRVQLLVTRANRQLAALQYIETLRRHATKTGQWPQSLAELKTDLPSDPVSGQPFAYKRLSETQAILEGPVPTGGDPVKDALRYEVTMVK